MEEPVALVFHDKKSLAKGFTEFFIKLVDQKTGVFNIALSGGSTPKIWFDYLAENHLNDLPWKRIHFYWGDERCVPPDSEESNFGMTKAHLLNKIEVPEKNIHRIEGELKPEEAAAKYEDLLEENMGVNPVFDLILLGMGDDGHTASIFPHQIDLWDSKRLCVVAQHPVSGQYRVSLSGKVINNAAAVAFLVTGDDKAERLWEIFENASTSVYYPASLVQPSNGSLHWFLDQEAAHLLET